MSYAKNWSWGSFIPSKISDAKKSEFELALSLPHFLPQQSGFEVVLSCPWCLRPKKNVFQKRYLFCNLLPSEICYAKKVSWSSVIPSAIFTWKIVAIRKLDPFWNFLREKRCRGVVSSILSFPTQERWSWDSSIPCAISYAKKVSWSSFIPFAIS